jgi:hypothetical protein
MALAREALRLLLSVAMLDPHACPSLAVSRAGAEADRVRSPPARAAGAQVFYGLRLRAGDRILTSQHEYAANLNAFLQARLIRFKAKPNPSLMRPALARVALSAAARVAAPLPGSAACAAPRAALHGAACSGPAWRLMVHSLALSRALFAGARSGGLVGSGGGGCRRQAAEVAGHLGLGGAGRLVAPPARAARAGGQAHRRGHGGRAGGAGWRDRRRGAGGDDCARAPARAGGHHAHPDQLWVRLYTRHSFLPPKTFFPMGTSAVFGDSLLPGVQ